MKLKCKYCNYEWLPRKDKPVQCPRCKRYDYEKEIDIGSIEK